MAIDKIVSDLKSFSVADGHEHVAMNAVMREREMFAYRLNIVNYQHSLDTLPKDEWPADIVRWRGTNPNDMAFHPEMDDATHDRVMAYMTRDLYRGLIRTEKRELSKTTHYYNAHMAHLPDDKKDDLIAAGKAKMDAMNKQLATTE